MHPAAFDVALGRLMALAVATRLPEIAIVTSAALSGSSAWQVTTSWVLFRTQRRVAGMVLGSLVVLTLHELGMAGLFAIAVG